MANLQSKILLKSIAGALRGANERQKRNEKTRLEELELEDDKRRTDAYVKKAKADLNYQRIMGATSIANIDLAEKRLSLRNKEFKAQQDLNAITLANARAKNIREQKQLEFQAAEGKRKYAQMLLKEELRVKGGGPGAGFGYHDVTPEEAMELAEEAYGGVGVLPGAQEEEQTSFEAMMSALNEKY